MKSDSLQSSRPNVLSGHSSNFRPDIEGLRAVAVLSVVLWHAGIPFVQGGFTGVDVFFVISGYLMTNILLREASLTGTVSVGRFYARRAKRLIPASSIVLVLTLVFSYVFLPVTRWESVGVDAIGSALYAVNWLFAERSVDYLSESGAASPLQHFWSLSVEEQYYLVFPAALLLLLFVSAFWSISTRITAAALLSATIVGSLALSVFMTYSEPSRAYFVTGTRVWELALGGLAAMAAPYVANLSGRVLSVASWFGLSLVAMSIVFLGSETAFPGYIALLPTLGTATVLVAGSVPTNRGAIRFLGFSVLQWFGRGSYSLYLWHWPVLVLGGYIVTRGLRQPSIVENSMLAAFAIVPAWLSLRFVEDPVRKSRLFENSIRNPLIMAISAALTCSMVAACLIYAARLSSNGEASYYHDKANPPGAAALLSDGFDRSSSNYTANTEHLVPTPARASDDNPPVYGSCHQGFVSSNPVYCTFGVESSPVTVVLVGDSHAAQWVNALDYVAKARNWRLITFTKSSCAFTSAPVLRGGLPYSSCTDWNERVRDEILEIAPMYVFVSSLDAPVSAESESVDPRETRVEENRRGLEASWSRLLEAGLRVVPIMDTPVSQFDVPDCVAGHRDNLEVCSTPKSVAMTDQGRSQVGAAEDLPSVDLVDMTSYLCIQEQCPAVVGGILVYRDSQHLTASYSESLGDPLDRELRELGLFDSESPTR